MSPLQGHVAAQIQEPRWVNKVFLQVPVGSGRGWRVPRARSSSQETLINSDSRDRGFFPNTYLETQKGTQPLEEKSICNDF